MGHDHHFLSRLDRVTSSEVELALSLYRDHELIREVLSHAKLPERAGRVAISLDDPKSGPFIVVARDGGFVTCLARDMRPRGLPIVTRKKLDGIAARVHKLRERLQLAVTLSGGRLTNLVSRIFTAGPRLSREEASAISAVQPLLWSHFFAMLGDLSADVHHARVIMRNIRKPRSREEEILRLSWEALWAIGHLVVFIGIDGRERVALIPEKLEWMKEDLLRHVFEQGVYALSLRGVWAASRIGRPLLSTLKRTYANAEGFPTLISSAFGLSAIGHRHPRLAAEVRSGFDIPDLPETRPRNRGINSIRQQVKAAMVGLLDEPHDAESVALSLGREKAHQWLSQGPSDSPYRFATKEEVPDEIARAFACWHWGTTGEEMADLNVLFRTTPWIVRQEAEDLFLPADLMNHMRFPSASAMALETLRRPLGALWMRAPQPIRVPETPGRNDPCLCGSGKKHKRCCGVS